MSSRFVGMVLTVLLLMGFPQLAGAQRLAGNPGGSSTHGSNQGGSDHSAGGDSKVAGGIAGQIAKIGAGVALGAAGMETVGGLLKGNPLSAAAGVTLKGTPTAGPVPDIYRTEEEMRQRLRAEYQRLEEKRKEEQKNEEVRRREEQGGPGSIRDALRPGGGTKADAPKDRLEHAGHIA